MSCSEPKPLASPELLAPAASLFPAGQLRLRERPALGGPHGGSPLLPRWGLRNQGALGQGTLCQMVPWFKVIAGWQELWEHPVPCWAELGGWEGSGAPHKLGDLWGALGRPRGTVTSGRGAAVTPGERGGGGVPAALAALGMAMGARRGAAMAKGLLGAPWGRPRPRHNPAAPHQINPNPRASTILPLTKPPRPANYCARNNCNYSFDALCTDKPAQEACPRIIRWP